MQHKGRIKRECVLLPFQLNPVIKKMCHFIHWQVVHSITQLFDINNWGFTKCGYTDVYKTQKSVLKAIVGCFPSFLSISLPFKHLESGRRILIEYITQLSRLLFNG